MSRQEYSAADKARSDLVAWQQASDRNAFDADPFFRHLAQRSFGEHFEQVLPRLHSVAQAAGSEIDTLVRESNRDGNLPVLRRYDAGLFVVSARINGPPSGTKGLGLFLIPRLLEDIPNGFALRRLKDKLGTRSMATGEIEFDGALGEAIGPTDQGFRNLVSIVLDTSRVQNAVVACGMMRRAFQDAHSFASHRIAFEHRIIEFPAVQEILARMKLCTMTALLTTFRILVMTDHLDTQGSNDELRAARRIAVMINKFRTSLTCTQTVRDGIEVLGGNGTIEDFSILPRLYRDAMVTESWEGTHNTLCAQLLRDFSTRGLHRPWLNHIRGEVAKFQHDQVAEQASLARQLLDDIENRIGRLLASDPVSASAHVRHVVDRMCRLSEWVGLVTQLQWELANSVDGETADACKLYRLTQLEQGDPQENSELIPLQRRLSERV